MSTAHDTLLLVQKLFVEVLPKFDWGAAFLDANAIEQLNTVPARVDAVIANNEFCTDAEVALARGRHCEGSDDEIEIDEPAKASRGEDGTWVQAWVFVPIALLNPEEEQLPLVL